MKKLVFGALALFVIIVGGWYWASPLVALDGLRSAARDGDTGELADRVDFTELRTSFREELRQSVRDEIAGRRGDGGDPLARFGETLAMATVDPVIDAAVTPEGIATLVRRGHIALNLRGRDNRGLEDESVEWSVERHGLDRFSAHLSGDAFGAPTLEFRRVGLGWKLVGIDIPETPAA
jgi:hypothetical protein